MHSPFSDVVVGVNLCVCILRLVRWFGPWCRIPTLVTESDRD